VAIRKETVRQQFMEALPSVLEPGEQVQAGAYCVSGPSPIWIAGLLGILGMLLFGVQYYFLAITDRRAILMKGSFWTARPAGLGFADPKDSILISDIVTDAKLWSHLIYGRPGSKPFRLNFHTWWREEMKQVVAALGGPDVAPPPPPGGAPPPPPPPPPPASGG
jgi:hypothetical protein